MKVRFQETLILDGKHALFVTEDDVQEFNHAASASDKELGEFDKQEILTFLADNIHIYYRGKMWGFNDTEAREEICKELEKPI